MRLIGLAAIIWATAAGCDRPDSAVNDNEIRPGRTQPYDQGLPKPSEPPPTGD